MPVNKDQFGSGTSPILTDNLLLLIVRRLERNERYLLALNKWSGGQVWRQELIELGYSTPVIWGEEVVVHGEAFLSGFDIHTGARNWNLLVKTGGESTPVVHEEILYVNAWHWLGHFEYPQKVPEVSKFLSEYDADKDELISRQEFPEQYFPTSSHENEGASGDINNEIKQVWDWFETDNNEYMDQVELQRYLNFCVAADQGIIALKSGMKGDIAANQILWRETENLSEVPSPLYYKDRIYVVKDGGFFSCVDASNGELKYKTRIKGTGPYFASPVAASNRIYVASHNGKVVVLEAGDEFNILITNNLKENILASPAIVDNKLYIRTEAHLYAFGD